LTCLITVYLRRWRFVIHGGVDGYSRVPVYLRCSNDNKASTVLSAFLGATVEFGLPSRVRSDRGGENVEIAWHMLSHPLREPNRGGMIVGRSVHNQRIERLWRDVYSGVLALYQDLFCHMERCLALNPSNELDLFCLHYIYLPRINQHLDTWKNAWIRHVLSGTGRTPMQLWVEGMQKMAASSHTPAMEMFSTDNEVYSVGVCM
jgi:hypothetical protein